MALTLYAGPQHWVLVPECFLPPREAEVYGPLRYTARIKSRVMTPEEMAEVMRQVEERSFALIPPDLGRWLGELPS